MEKLLTIDIAHPPLDASTAESVLDAALKQIQLSKTLRGLKIVYGLAGKGDSSQKIIADNWIFINRNRLKCAIQYDRVDTFGQNIEELAAECDFSIREEFGLATEWNMIIWVK